jgi:hypothetical protein
LTKQLIIVDVNHFSIKILQDLFNSIVRLLKQSNKSKGIALHSHDGSTRFEEMASSYLSFCSKVFTLGDWDKRFGSCASIPFIPPFQVAHRHCRGVRGTRQPKQSPYHWTACHPKARGEALKQLPNLAVQF